MARSAHRVNRIILIAGICGVLALLLGLLLVSQRPTVAAPPPAASVVPGPAVTATVPPADALLARFKEIQQQTPFPLAAPRNIDGFRASSPEKLGADPATHVEVILADQQNPEAKLWLGESVSFGLLNRMANVTSTQMITVRGATAKLEVAAGQGPVPDRVRISWQDSGVSYLCIAVNMPTDRVLQVVNSLQSVR